MPPVVTFIGWHNSGKTTLVCRVITALKDRGYMAGVIKSSKHTGISFDTPDSDTDRLSRAGAECVAFVSPDQVVIQGNNTGLSLLAMAHRFFQDMDIVIGEGFKNADGVDKIEVAGGISKQKLRDQVSGVIALVSDKSADGIQVFRPDDIIGIADFLEDRYIRKGRELAVSSLLVNGRKIPLTGFLEDCLAATVGGFVSTLKGTRDARHIEVSIRLPEKSQEKERQ